MRWWHRVLVLLLVLCIFACKTSVITSMLLHQGGQHTTTLHSKVTYQHHDRRNLVRADTPTSALIRETPLFMPPDQPLVKAIPSMQNKRLSFLILRL